MKAPSSKTVLQPVANRWQHVRTWRGKKIEQLVFSTARAVTKVHLPARNADQGAAR